MRGLTCRTVGQRDRLLHHVLRMRENERATLAQVAHEIGRSPERVRQLEHMGRKRFR